MNLTALAKEWEKCGTIDPLWAILSRVDKKGNKWELGEFFMTGTKEIHGVMTYLQSLHLTLANKKALDFGCGVGRLSRALGPYFEEVVGVDIAPIMIQLAQKYNHLPNVRFCLNQAPFLRIFDDSHFNFIYTNITLQHMEATHVKQYISEFLRVLAPKGVLVFDVPYECLLKTNSVSLKDRVYYAVPDFLRDLYQGIRRRNPFSNALCMHAVKKEIIVKIVERNHGQVLDILPHPGSGPDWLSYRYCVIKQ